MPEITWNPEFNTASANTIFYNANDVSTSGMSALTHYVTYTDSPLPTPPKFRSVEEANAWLIKNSASPE